MSPKFFSSAVLIILLLTIQLSASAQQRNNVLFIPVDDMNDRVSFLGWPEVVTPNLQRLLDRGMLFTRAYVQYPVCSASRTSFLSGWRPDRTGIFSNSIRPRSIIDSSVKFLPEYFKQNGYHTERYGKIMHGKFENDITWDHAEPDEVDEMLNSNNRIVEPDNDFELVSPSSPGGWYVKNVNDTIIADGKMATRLVKRMQQPQTQPFFYGLGLLSPHYNFTPNLKYWNMTGDPSVQELLPYNDAGATKPGFTGNGSANILLPNSDEPPNDRNDVPPLAFYGMQLIKETYELKRTIHAYDADVIMMDAQLGLVLDELDRQNLWANTIVVFFGDHGQHLGEHEGQWEKQTLFEQSLHIPFIICVPGKPGGVCDKLIELIDVYPTLIELCGLPPVPGTEASSFARLLDNPNQTWKKAVFSQVQRGETMARSITTERYRYNSWDSSGEELYDHGNDPKEYTNQVNNPAYASVLSNMKKILVDGWTKSLPPPVDTITYYKDDDHDGYGAATNSVRSWYQPIGYTPYKKDCDDSNAELNPGVTDICDGIDNNCNDLIDETCLPQLSINSRIMTEGNSGTKNMRFTISLSQPGISVIKVRVTTADSTAVSGSDYTGGTGMISFLPGQTSKKISVPITGDLLPERNEFFKVILSKPKNATILNGIGTGKIRNDDGTALPAVQQNQSELAVNIKPLLSKYAEVWPNPTGNILNIQFHHLHATKTKITLMNLTGSKIKEWKNTGSSHAIQLDLTSIPGGEYFLSITDDKGISQTEKIIILH